jgi:hypothetical protein
LTLLAAAAIGCGRAEDGAASVGPTKSALAVKVSGPLSVDAPPEWLPASPPVASQMNMVCGSVRCLAVYPQFVFGATRMLATRLAQDGSAVDRPRLLLRSRVIGIRAVAARDDEFLVATLEENFDGPVHVYRINGATGAVDEVTSLLPSRPSAIGASKDRWIVSYVNGPKWEVVVLDAAFKPVGPAQSHTAAATGTVPHIVAGDGQFLLAYPGAFLRVNASTGALIDAAPVVFSNYKVGKTRGVFKNGVYQLVWATTDTGQVFPTLYGSRVRASDGVVLDADDTFNQVSGAKVLCTACGAGLNQSRFNDPVFVNDVGVPNAVLMTWIPPVAGTPLSGALLDVTTGLRVDGKTTGAQATGPELRDAPLIHTTGTWGAAFDPQGAHGLTVTTNPLAFTSKLSGVFFNSAPRTSPGVGSNGSQFLAAWMHGADVLATRMDNTTGAYLDGPPLALGTGNGNAIAIAGRGDDYLVAWTDKKVVRLRVVHPNGTMDAPLTPITASDSNDGSSLQAWDPRLIWNGKYFLLTWTVGTSAPGEIIRGVRLNAQGAAVDAAFIRLSPSSSKQYVTLADTAPPENMRTFLVAYQGPTSAVVRRFRSESGVLVEPVTSLPVPVDQPIYGASDGSKMLVTYYGMVGQQSGPVISAIDPVSGDLTGTPSIVRITSVGPEPADAWHDGKSFVLLVSNRRQGLAAYDLSVRRVDGALAPLDTAVPGAGTLVAGGVTRLYEQRAVATDGKGHSLLLHQFEDLDRLGTSIKGRLLTNDGLATPPPTADAGIDAAPADAGPIPDGAAPADGPAPADAGAPVDAPTGLDASNGGDDAATDASTTIDGATANDGSSASDGSSQADARTDGATAAKDARDAGAEKPAPASSGCGCHVATPESSMASLVLALALFGGAVRGRRRGRNAR